MNTDTISTGIIAVDYSKSLQNMMADGSYDWVNPAITPKGFPITAVGIVQFETKVFHFNRYISSEDAVEAITADDRRNFWEPAKIEGLLAYGVKNPNEQRQYPIVGLGSFAGSRLSPFVANTPRSASPTAAVIPWEAWRRRAQPMTRSDVRPSSALMPSAVSNAASRSSFARWARATDSSIDRT